MRATGLVDVNAQVVVRDRDWAFPLIATGLPHWFRPPSGSVLTTFRVAGVRPAEEFAVAALVWGYREISLALVNPSAEEPVEVTLYGLNLTGRVQGENTVSILPMHRVSRFLHEFSGLLGDPPQALTVSARIDTNGPIAVAALLNPAPDSVPTDIPMTALPENTIGP